MAETSENQHQLRIERTFVVQLYADARVEARSVSGRVEHVASGQAAGFSSLEALLEFFATRIQHAGDSQK